MNVYELASKKSDISTQILYGEKFSVIGRKKVFLKIRTDFDNYVGFIKKEKFNKFLDKTHKVNVLKSKFIHNIMCFQHPFLAQPHQFLILL